MSPMFVIQNIRAGLHLACVCSDFDFIIHKVMFLLSFCARLFQKVFCYHIMMLLLMYRFLGYGP